ncbi:MAG: PEP-CTERM sorting domain-containing protein [Planctomycetes bacterium]|nr:PEP-CTERM sorting domain-containing protein [Planctomycetota bacterium]
MKSALKYLASGLILFTAVEAFAHPGPRVHLYLDGGRLYTGFEVENADSTITVTPGVTRVFHGDLASIATFGWTTQFPGFASTPGSVATPVVSDGTATPLPEGTVYYFNFLGPLRYFSSTIDPADSLASFGVAPDSSALLVTGTDGGPAESGAGPTAGFQIGTAGAIGSKWHKHLRYQIDQNHNSLPDGTLDSGFLTPADGQYLIELEVYFHPTPETTLRTAPFYILFAKNVPDAVTDLSIEAINNSLIPEPASLMLLGGGAAVLLWRRRRS